MGLENKTSGYVGPVVKHFLSSEQATIGQEPWLESSLKSGCGLSHESAQDSCNGTYVKLEASKPTWSGIWYIKGYQA